MVNKDISIETLPAEGKSRKSPRSTNMQAILAVRHYMEKKYGLDPRVGRNMERLAAGGYVFRQGLVSDPRKKGWEGSRSGIGRASVPPERGEDQDTHRGDERYHGILREMAVETGSQEGQVHSVIRRLFNRNVRYQNKILLLEADEIAGFLQDNQVLLTQDMKEAMDTELAHVHMRINQVEEVPFCLSRDMAAPADLPAAGRALEDYLSHCPEVVLCFRNGDGGEENLENWFSLVYEDNYGKQRYYYPDYIVVTKQAQGGGERVWILEIKPGFQRDSPVPSPKKFRVLKTYLDQHGFAGGFVRLSPEHKLEISTGWDAGGLGEWQPLTSLL